MNVLSLPLLLIGAVAAAGPRITIDSCISVDPDEVRRLTLIEVGSDGGGMPADSLEVVVGCHGKLERLRLIDENRGLVAERSIDLRATQQDDRDANARELALAIAELLRRAHLEQAARNQSLEPNSATQPAEAREEPPAATGNEEITARGRWSTELGAAATVVGWTGGEWLYGADWTGRVHLGRFWIAELRAGGRRTRTIELSRGSMNAHGVSALAGVAFDAAPGVAWVGASFGLRAGVDWLRYAAVDGSETIDGTDAAGFNVQATATAFLSLSDPFRVTLDLATGTALRPIVIEQNGETLSGWSGVSVSGALGLAIRY